MSDKSGNGSEVSTQRLESVMRFLGLAQGQRRGERKPLSEPRQRTDEEMRNITLANWLSAEGGQLLMSMLDIRIEEAYTNSQIHVANHPLCAGFLGAQAALRSLRDDLKRLKG